MNQKLLFSLFALTLLIFLPQQTHAQFFHLDRQPRLVVGGSVGTFRLSYEEFKTLYDGRWMNSTALHGSYLIKAPYNILLKYRTAGKTASAQINGEPHSLDWQETIYNFGIRYIYANDRRVANFFSFGFMTATIEENGTYSLFGDRTAPRKSSAGGFFLDTGVFISITARLQATIELEISSAALEGKSGFEGTSVGGYYLAAGLTLFLF